MKLLIIGASGPTGRHVLEKALQEGDTVTVFCRHPESLKDVKGDFFKIAGDATSQEDLVKAMTSQEAVISTLGRGKSTQANNLFSQSAKAIVQAAKIAKISRLVWLSSFGVGETFQDATMIQKFMYRTLLKDIYANKKASEKTIRESHLKWTIVYPTALMNGSPKGKYRVHDRIKMKGAPRIDRADVAEFMYKAVQNDEWSFRNAVITN
ncbi:NAD(P)-dependent oxidoreductase [Saccharibacillus endophyticus]|uniref:NAD dependent epimerase/dehydratase n=1 Tax=Saccharibacillus endophyticus TaxID=2060666 RepID=A0ABQ1ZX34_9BACL|nr:NAD(P)H-binding protein [Saccharibacillus endophyticus]GGH80781.1 NAD dependent epimerase/dehydratase [Saccharibacillus endophyticus]